MSLDDEIAPITREDAGALIGVLANLEGHSRLGDVTPHAVEHLQRRLARDLGADASTPLEDMLATLITRLRRALGEPT
ncbi:hypothetical protein [Luteimicrobium subarcticum]|uniref:Uncharacterized protein n=1 Tax=Luteimicrobium subarcticum TaxID=620910 RepID=A0A2M8W6L8_9MICO|nr:hypothetical protein [Luteimicrobium subarcticum]PJI86577.1 hypothetical protein CLV34_2495 [Luteimicrobium subarcticum]